MTGGMETRLSHSGAQPRQPGARAAHRQTLGHVVVCGDTWEAFTTSTVHYSYVKHLLVHNKTLKNLHLHKLYA